MADMFNFGLNTTPSLQAPTLNVPNTMNFGMGIQTPGFTANPALVPQNRNMLQFGNMNANQVNPLSMGANTLVSDFSTGANTAPTTGMTGFGTQNFDVNQLGQQQQNSGFFGDMGAGDWLNFGTGIAGLAINASYQNRALEQQQQSLDLAQQKYDDYRADQAKLDSAYANFGGQ